MDQIDNGVLLKKLKSGDDHALECIVSQNMGLVKSIALRFKDRGCEYEDLLQIGSIGLIKAARSFDFSFGCVFSTYAVPLIIGEIRRFLRDDGPVKVNRTLKQMGVRVLRKKEAFIRENGREPSLSELSELCDIGREELACIIEANSQIHSLNESCGGDDGLTLENVIADKNDRFSALEDKIALSDAIGKLSPEHRKIVFLRYFKDMSQQKTGDILGMTQVKISREEKKILAILRAAF